MLISSSDLENNADFYFEEGESQVLSKEKSAEDMIE